MNKATFKAATETIKFMLNELQPTIKPILDFSYTTYEISLRQIFCLGFFVGLLPLSFV